MVNRLIDEPSRTEIIFFFKITISLLNTGIYIREGNFINKTSHLQALY